MASWRDDVSQAAQGDLDELLAAVLPFAEETLGKSPPSCPPSRFLCHIRATEIADTDPYRGGGQALRRPTGTGSKTS